MPPTQQTHAVAPDQVEQAVFAAIQKRILVEHLPADPHFKAAIKFDPAVLKAKFDAFEPQLKQFLQIIGPVPLGGVQNVVAAALAFYDAVNGAITPTPAAG